MIIRVQSAAPILPVDGHPRDSRFSSNQTDDVRSLTSRHVRRAIDGDLASTAWIVERFGPYLAAIARRHAGWEPSSRALDPDELIQETWSIALPRLRDIKPEGGRTTPVLLSFLAGVLWRRHRTLLRQHLRKRDGQAPHSAAWDALADSTRGAVSRTMHAEATEELQRALNALPAENRDIVIMRSLERLSTGAIGEMLGLTPDAVSARYRRALEQLRTKLKDPLLKEIFE